MDEKLRSRLRAAAAGGASVLALTGILMSNQESGGRVYHIPYRDPVGILTVCDGITGPDVIPGKYYSDNECTALREKHIKIAADAVHRTIHVPLNTWQQVALNDFTANVGAGNLAKSSMAREFNAGNYTGGCNALVAWVKARVKGGYVVLPGLVTRRGIEQDLCLHGV